MLFLSLRQLRKPEADKIEALNDFRELSQFFECFYPDIERQQKVTPQTYLPEKKALNPLLLICIAN